MHTSDLTPTESEARYLEGLASLNQIGAAINRAGKDHEADALSTLGLIVDSAIKVVPGAAAVIYIYDPARGVLDPSTRYAAGDWMAPSPGIEPRLDGMGVRAVSQRRRVISYEEPDFSIHPMLSAVGALTAACFPLIAADQPLGVLYVYLDQERRFTQLEQLMMENFVNQAALAIAQNQRLAVMRRDLARKNEELAHLRRAGLLISSRLRLKDTLETILQMALEVTGARYGIFRLLDAAAENLVTAAIAGEQLAQPLVETLPVQSNSIMGWVARNRRPALVPDLLAPPWVNLYYRLDAGLEMRSELAVPLVGAGGRLEGVLNLESPQVAAFSEADSHLLQSLAAQAVIAIQEVRLLDALQEIAPLLLTQNRRKMLARLAELARNVANADFSVLWVVEDGQPGQQAAGGKTRPDAAALILDLARRSIRQRAAVVETLRLLPPEAGQLNAVVVPIASRDSDALGALGIFSHASPAASFAEADWDTKVVTILAQYAALSIQNAAQQEALRQAQEQRAVAETFAVVGDVAANLLHQLNNKVGTIPVRIQGIQDKCQPALTADRYLQSNLDEIERSANEAMQAVRENLAHLRPIHIAEVQVAACVQEAIQAAHLPDGIRVGAEGLDDLPVVMAGARTLALVFTNLLDNAADAMSGAGTILIRGVARRQTVDITVSDSGPGIPAELHDRIFELNYSGRKPGRGGKLGFGLWWVRTLMARLGGSVTVESDGLRGATFRLRLPVAEDRP
jgi:signal transduction histidine kinase/putative methionine-R-sulfoxide reductase with GAF domain